MSGEGVDCAAIPVLITLLVIYTLSFVSSFIATLCFLRNGHYFFSPQRAFVALLALSFALRTTETSMLLQHLKSGGNLGLNDFSTEVKTFLMLDMWGYITFWIAKMHFLFVWGIKWFKLGLNRTLPGYWVPLRVGMGCLGIGLGVALTIWQVVVGFEQAPTDFSLGFLYLVAAISFAVAGTVMYRTLNNFVAKNSLFTPTECSVIVSKARTYAVVAFVLWWTLLGRTIHLMIGGVSPQSNITFGCHGIYVAFVIAVSVEVIPPSLAVAFFPDDFLNERETPLIPLPRGVTGQSAASMF